MADLSLREREVQETRVDLARPNRRGLNAGPVPVVRDAGSLREGINRRFHAEAEARLGRKLTDGERHVDVAGILSALERGKQDLADLIRKEQRRVAGGAIKGHTREQMKVTPEMVKALNWLHEQGRREAVRELARHGITAPAHPPREYAVPRGGAVRRLISRLTGFLPTISVRTQDRAVKMTLAQESNAAVLRAASRIPGALDAASRLVSSAYYAGMGDVFSASADLISGWTYSAVLDGATCDECADKDGTEYETWDDAQDDMPDGGPNPDCFGDGRCRCRLVPNGPADQAATSGDQVDGSGAITGDEADTTLWSDQASWAQGVGADDLDAFKTYVQGDYEGINTALRAGDDLNAYKARVVDKLDAALGNAPQTKQDLVLWRGVTDPAATFGTDDLRSLVGKTLTDNGYFSTTTAEEASVQAARDGVTMKILAPAGTRGAWIPALAREHSMSDWATLEREMLLPRGTAYEIVSVDGNVVTVRLEESRSSVGKLIQPPKGDPVSVANAAGEFVDPRMVREILDRGLDGASPAESAAARRILGGANDTMALHAPNGVWTADREALHREIVDTFFRGKFPGSDKGAYFTSGGSASGKSAAAFRLPDGSIMKVLDQIDRATGEIVEGGMQSHPNYILVDADHIKSFIPEYQQLKALDDPFAASAVHEESSYLSKLILREAQDRGFATVLDSTGNGASFVAKLQAQIDAEREVHVQMFSIPTNTAIERAMGRALNPESSSFGRFVRMGPIKSAHKGASDALVTWKDLSGVTRWEVMDNSGAEPILVAEGEGGRVTVHDWTKWKAILAKADE